MDRNQILSCCWVVLAASALLMAQGNSGEIQVSVKDPAGNAMEASGRLQNVAAGAEQRFRIGVDGLYTLKSVAYGRYRLEVARGGFVTHSELIEVTSDAPVLRAITMAIGAAATTMNVVATTPLAGGGVAVQEVSAPVQAATLQDIEASGALDLSDFLNRRLSGVHINENQENPFQPDLNYRGYTASPLLGTPQGLSIYLDGVRQNQPFGDVVSWDLIPKIAIAEVELVPGSNPLFGLNTLGGAISVATKDGRGQPGGTLQASGGSFGRSAFEAEYGGANARGWNWYAAGNLFHEDGWRTASPSDVRQAFGKVGRQGAKTNVWLSFADADNSLAGNGLQEQRFLARDYASVYTLGDSTKNKSPSVNLSLQHAAGAKLTFSGNAYFRYIRADTVNPNLNTNSLDESAYQPTAADQAALKAAGYSGYPTSGANAANTPFPYWRCIAQSLLKSEPIEKCNGIIINSAAKQNNYGLSGQFTLANSPGGHRNQLTGGAAWDRSSVIFQQSAQFAYLNPNRTLTPVNAFEDGTTNSNGTPVDTRVYLHGQPQTGSVYAADTVAVGRGLSLNVSGRYNRTTIGNRDRFQPGGGPGSLNGQYVFGRFNPAVGATYSPVPYLSFYGSYSESSRAPTSIELGCADPNNPCNLPNALAGDPPLKQVVTRTVEAGVRGAAEQRVKWSAGWFRGENHDDLLFVAAAQTGNGYFKNFGQTRRQGMEARLSGRVRRFDLGGNYTFVSATYESAETIDGSSNSGNDTASAGAFGLDGLIRIQPGSQIPLIPRHLVKAYADLQVTRKASVDVAFIGTSRAFARGNENNLSGPSGVYYLGPGSSPGYGVTNLSARYQVLKRVQLFVQVNNVFDHHYYTAAQLGPTGFSTQGNFVARPFAADKQGNYAIVHATFYAPGAPIGAWGGVRVRF